MTAYYSYDESGRISSIRHLTSGGAENNREEKLTAYYTYDDDGRLTEQPKQPVPHSGWWTISPHRINAAEAARNFAQFVPREQKREEEAT